MIDIFSKKVAKEWAKLNWMITARTGVDLWAKRKRITSHFSSWLWCKVDLQETRQRKAGNAYHLFTSKLEVNLQFYWTTEPENNDAKGRKKNHKNPRPMKQSLKIVELQHRNIGKYSLNPKVEPFNMAMEPLNIASSCDGSPLPLPLLIKTIGVLHICKHWKHWKHQLWNPDINHGIWTSITEYGHQSPN